MLPIYAQNVQKIAHSYELIQKFHQVGNCWVRIHCRQKINIFDYLYMRVIKYIHFCLQWILTQQFRTCWNFWIKIALFILPRYVRKQNEKNKTFNLEPIKEIAVIWKAFLNTITDQSGKKAVILRGSCCFYLQGAFSP